MRRKRGVEAVHDRSTQLPRVIHDEVRCVLQTRPGTVKLGTPCLARQCITNLISAGWESTTASNNSGHHERLRLGAELAIDKGAWSLTKRGAVLSRHHLTLRAHEKKV